MPSIKQTVTKIREPSRRSEYVLAQLFAAKYQRLRIVPSRADDPGSATMEEATRRTTGLLYTEISEAWRLIESQKHEVLTRALVKLYSPREASVDADVEAIFARLARQWRQENLFASSVTDIVSNEAYLQIIGLGSRALPLILRELSKEPDHWFVALMSITREDPVPPEDAGNMERMRQAWLELGEERGWI